METHNPDIYGAVGLAGSEGLANQKLISNGPGNQVTWDTTDVTVSWTNNTLNVNVDGVSDNEVLNLISSDVGNIAVAGTDGRVLVNSGSLANAYRFNLPIAAAVHVIVHNLNNAYPNVTVWNLLTGQVIIPTSIITNSVNQVTINVSAPRAIAGIIIG